MRFVNGATENDLFVAKQLIFLVNDEGDLVDENGSPDGGRDGTIPGIEIKCWKQNDDIIFSYILEDKDVSEPQKLPDCVEIILGDESDWRFAEYRCAILIPYDDILIREVFDEG